MKEYLVLSQKDKWFSGKFDPEKLEQALNSYASQGWRVATSATADMPGGFGGTRQEIVIILERDVKATTEAKVESDEQINISAHISVYKGYVFIEGDYSAADKVKEVNVELKGIGAQLKNINDIKDELIKQAEQNNCNCIVNFKYGQKAALLALDDVKFYGSGVCAVLDFDNYQEIIKKYDN